MTLSVQKISSPAKTASAPAAFVSSRPQLGLADPHHEPTDRVARDRDGADEDSDREQSTRRRPPGELTGGEASDDEQRHDVDHPSEVDGGQHQRAAEHRRRLHRVGHELAGG